MEMQRQSWQWIFSAGKTMTMSLWQLWVWKQRRKRRGKYDGKEQGMKKDAETTKEKMQERGKIAVDDKTAFQMDMQVEWNMTDDCKQFNIRAALVNIMEKIQMVDNRTYVKSSITNSIWKELMDILNREAFNEAFNVQQEQIGNKPPNVRMYIQHHNI
eukprot:8321001-Ditylum_brightwellii.AAC.1